MQFKNTIILLFLILSISLIGGVNGSDIEDSTNITIIYSTFIDDTEVNENRSENVVIDTNGTSVGINDPYTTNPIKDEEGHTILGTKEQTINSYNNDGALNWKYNLDSWAITNPVIGSDGTIYVGLENGEVLALTPEGNLKWNQTTHKQIQSLEKTDDGVSLKTYHDEKINIDSNGNCTIEEKEEANGSEMKIPTIISYNILLSKNYYHSLKRKIIKYDEENGEVSIEYELN